MSVGSDNRARAGKGAVVAARFFLFSLLVILSLSGCRQPADYRETRLLMGTVVSIEIAGVSDTSSSAVLEAVWDEAEALEKIFSRYDPAGELGRINSRTGTGPVNISPEMAEVLQRSQQINRLSGGAFDITVAPLMEIWGFFPRREGRVPSEKEIRAALKLVDGSKLRLDREAATVFFEIPGARIDLGGLAKGYIVDRIAARLRRSKVESGLINAGGDIYGLGEKPGGGPWRIGVEDPRREGEVIMVIELTDRAVATSGDYRNYFIRGQKRYSHIIDPRTGKPAESGVLEVTILAPDCMTADALATAVSILGVEPGLKLIDSLEEVEGLIVALEEGEPRVYYSRGLDDA